MGIDVCRRVRGGGSPDPSARSVGGLVEEWPVGGGVWPCVAVKLSGRFPNDRGASSGLASEGRPTWRTVQAQPCLHSTSFRRNTVDLLQPAEYTHARCVAAFWGSRLRTL